MGSTCPRRRRRWVRLSRWGVALRPVRCRFLPPGPRDRRSARGGSLPAPAVPWSSGAAGPLRGAGGAGCLGHLRPQHVTSCCPHHSLRTPAVRGHHRKELRHWPGVLHANLKHCPARDGARSTGSGPSPTRLSLRHTPSPGRPLCSWPTGRKAEVPTTPRPPARSIDRTGAHNPQKRVPP